ncbi:MAG: HIT family protein [Cyanobacteria bacterium REEB67]|nr:HIT family protein [Cyanobacteria bacterium REEB67]
MHCTICKLYENDRSTFVYENEHWLLRHSTETNLEGYLILESRRHCLDFAEASEAELASYGPTIGLAMKAIKNVVQPYRIYTFSLAESMPHLHVHLIPRGEDMPRAWIGRGIMAYPLTPAVSGAAMPQICARMKAELKKLSLIG